MTVSPPGFTSFGWFTSTDATPADRVTMVLTLDPNGGRWIAAIVIRPPNAPTSDLSFTIRGNIITLLVFAERLGDPENLTWHVATSSNPFETTRPPIDRVPSSGDATWPALSFGQ